MSSAGNSLDRSASLRGKLVNTLRRQGLLKSARVEAAFRSTVPRHLFVPHVDLDRAYSDQSISIEELGDVSISSSSQPAVMALMLEHLTGSRASACWRLAQGRAIRLRCSGPDSSLGERVAASIRAWGAVDRPGIEGMRLAAYPAQRRPTPNPDQVVLPKRWTTLLIG